MTSDRFATEDYVDTEIAGVGGGAPDAHAASHQDGGSDELALDGSQITAGTVADARIASTITRDSEAASAYQPLTARLTTLAGTSDTGTGAVVRATSPELTTPTGIVKGDVGLGNVDNTTDTGKPVSTAQQTALDLKAPLASPTFTGTVAGVTKSHVGLGSVDNTADTAKPVSTAQQTALNLKANIASPTFTGTVTIPTGGSITAPTGLVKGDVGLGNVDNTSDATKNAATATLTNKKLTPREVTVASSATPTPNADTTDIYTITAQAAAAAFAAPTGTPVQGQELLIRIKDDGSARALTWDAVYRNQTAVNTLPTTTVVGRTHYFHFVYNSTDTKWDLRFPDTYDKTGVDFLLAGKASTNPLATDTLWGAKGDQVIATANDTAARLAVGTFGQVLVADTTATPGLIYANPQSLRDKYCEPGYATIPLGTVSNQAPLTSGRVSLFAIALPKNLAVTSITFFSATQAIVAATNWWFALCNSTFSTLRSTADQTSTAWAANTIKTVNLASQFTTTYEGLYYLAIMVTAGTVPSLSCAAISLGSIGTQASPSRALNGIGSQTTPAADGTNLATSPSLQNSIAYAYAL